MIARMKKVTIITLAASEASSLETLRELGVVQVECVSKPGSADVERARSQMDALQKALSLLSARKPRALETVDESAETTVQRVISLSEEETALRDRLEMISREMERLVPLGHFSSEDFDRLRQNGIIAKIYACKKRRLNREELPVPCLTIGAAGGLRYLLAVDDKDFDLPFDEIPIPEKGPSALQEERRAIEKKLETVETEFDRCAANVPLLRPHTTALKEDLEFAEVLAGMDRVEELSYLRGFCPEDDIHRLRAAGRDLGWGLVIREPREDDDVPTLLKNRSWIRIIEPLFDFMGTFPGYREFDLSFWFLASLSLFFAMLIGDGGYGLVFLAGTLVLNWKIKGAPGALCALLYVFSAATIFWGLITGTWFGVEALAAIPVMSDFVVSSLYSYSNNQDYMIHFCFVIGTVHLTLAHGIRMIRYIASVRLLAEVGWMMILWFLYFLAETLVLGRPFPPLAVYLLAAGVFLVSAFTNPRRNIFAAFFLTLADLPLNIIRSFSDVISYIRLFAVGYATLVLAMSFNQMAEELGWGSPIRVIGAALILLLGHSMNVILGGMAVLVHGVRLNMLEFSSHLEMNWSGRKFEPFRRRMSGFGVRTNNPEEHEQTVQ